MASTNFKIFSENGLAMSDADYNIDGQRQNGVTPGLALPKLHNKLYKQATIMNAAMGQIMAEAGYNARDDNFQELKNSIKDTFITKAMTAVAIDNILKG